MNGKAVLRITSTAALAMVSLATSALADPGASFTSVSKIAARAESVRFYHDETGPKVRLEDGQEFSLMPLPEALKQKLQSDMAAAPAGAAEADQAAAAELLDLIAWPPAWVDNRAWHGPIRNQGGRGTCVSFACTAAVEGRYRRMNPAAYASLDLSEQWANHVQKMVHLIDKGAAQACYKEDQMGCWGGSNEEYAMRVLQKYGLPVEGAMAYNPSGSYENTEEPGDNPKVYWWDPTTPQRTIDDFNLDPNNLPLSALATAPYRPTKVTNLSYNEARDTNLIEWLVAGGYDVVLGFGLVKPLVKNADGAWVMPPNPQPWGGHSMLIVGYNRSKHYFIVRNSWGYDNTDGGYARLSYEYIQKCADGGCYVTEVADPGTETSRAKLYVGRWQMNHDGWQGVLDIYRLPGLFKSSELNGQADYRIGTYFGGDGKAFRVNGYLWGKDLVFYIDFGNPNAPYGSLAGQPFTAHLFSWDDQNMAGLAWWNGMTFSFHATKGTTPAHVAASPAATLRDAYTGHWKMNHDGWKGDLYLYAGSSATGFDGWYRDLDGNWHSVTGWLEGANIRFYIWFGSWQQFYGRIYSWDKGLMSGITWWGSQEFGFTAARQAS